MKYLITGLGNPGAEYEETRHNIGFKVVDLLAAGKEAPLKTDTLGHTGLIRHKGRQIYLLKPSTYMNRSGKAVRYWMEKLQVPRENLLVLLDDLNLPFGKQRLRPEGSDGGHNGLKDINAVLGHQNYARLRLGIGDNFSKGRQVDYVLGEWSPAERAELSQVLDYAADTVLSFCSIGIQHTMNTFNKK